MNSTELKIISKYMELKELELIGLSIITEEISEKAFFTFPNIAIVLSNGNTVVAIDVDDAERNDDLEYIKENFETLMTFKKYNYIIIKL